MKKDQQQKRWLKEIHTGSTKGETAKDEEEAGGENEYAQL